MVEIGDSYSFEIKLTAAIVDLFGNLSGDFNPVHFDDLFARKRGFNNRLAHGGLLIAFLSRMVGMHLPGENAILHSIKAKFIKPAYVGDTVLVQAVVEHISKAVNAILLDAMIKNASTGEILLKAELQVGITGTVEEDNNAK